MIRVEFKDALEAMESVLSVVVIGQLERALSYEQKLDLLADVLDAHRVVSGRLHDQAVHVSTRRGVPAAARERILERDERRCLACGAAEDLAIDHVVPLALGGLHVENNFQTLCRSCNSAKGTSVIDYRLDNVDEDEAEASEAEGAAAEGMPGVFPAGDEVQVLRPDPPVVASAA